MLIWNLVPLGIIAALRAVIAQYPKASLIVLLLGSFLIYNAAVGALPTPTEKNGPFYRFCFRFLHLVAFNLQYALRAKFPQYVPPDASSATPPPGPTS